MSPRRALRRVATVVAATSLFAALPSPGADASLAPLIAFTTNRDGQHEVYVMGTDGGAQTNLTNHVASDMDPAWSPDGTRIAFASNRDGDFEIYVMGADGTNVTQVTSNLVDDRRPDWSPDGARLVFDRNGGIHEDLWSANPDGTAPKQLTYTLEREFAAAYSVDGTRITFTRANRYMLNPDQLWVMLADGTRQIVFASQLGDLNHARDGAWSPDGELVAYARGGGPDPADPEPDGWSLTVMEEDATRDRVVGAGPQQPGIWTVADPAWSPDSSSLAFTGGETQDPGTEEVYVIGADGTGLTKLTDNSFTLGAYDGQPDWQPVGAPAYVAPAAVTERLLISSSRNEAFATTTVFQPGFTYRVEVHGEYHWAHKVQGQRTDELMADAECSTQGQKYLRNQFALLDPTGDALDLQIGKLNTEWTAVAGDDVGCATDADHTYEWTFRTSKPGRLNMKVRDIKPSAYSDNVGVLTVNITTL